MIARRRQFENERSRFRRTASQLVQANHAHVDENLKHRLEEMIRYAISRHDWYEDQRHRFLQLAIGLITIALGLGTLVFTDRSHDLRQSLPLWIGLAGLAATGLLIVVLYIWLVQSAHPYREVVDIRSWFFAYNIPKQLSPRISRNASRAENQVSEIVNFFERTASRWWDYARDPEKFVEEDVEQVFILQILQRYRQQNLKQMQRVLAVGVIVSVLSLGLGFWKALANEPSTDGGLRPSRLEKPLVDDHRERSE